MSWEVRKLGDVCEIKGGKRVPKGYKLQSEPTDHPYIRVTDFNDNGTVGLDDLRYINDSVFNQIKNYTISKKDLYLSIAGTIGKTGIIPDELDGSNLTENACKLVFKINIYNKFVYYFTQTKCFQEEAGLNTRTTAMPKLALTRLSSIEIPIPPLAEQKRIGAILDEAFSAISTAKENAEKNLKNAKELFESYLNNIFEKKGKDWEEKKLGEVAEYNIGLTYSPKDVCENGIIVLRSSNIQNGQINMSDLVRVNKPVKDSLKVKIGDILMCSRNGSKRLVGKTATIKELKEEMTYGTFMMTVRSQSNPFLAYFFTTDKFRKQISGGENTMINQITKYMLDVVKLYLPPFKEQHRIVAKLDALSEQTKKLEAVYIKKIADLDELKKSILQKAFKGEL